MKPEKPPLPTMGRPGPWLRRMIPAHGARVVEIRDGDALVARVPVARGRPSDWERDVAEACEGHESRSLSLSLLDSQGVEAARMTWARPDGARAQASAQGLLGSVLKDNETLRRMLMEQTAQVTAALLAENKRLAAQLTAHEEQAFAMARTRDKLESRAWEREREQRKAEKRDEYQGKLLGVLEEKLIPAIVQRLGQGGAQGKLVALLSQAIRSAPDEVMALAEKLPEDAAKQLDSLLVEVQVQKQGVPARANGNGKGNPS